MSARFAFAAIMLEDGAVVGRAVMGLPGLDIDHELGTFATWTQANEFARRLNEGFGLSPWESRNIVTEAMLAQQRGLLTNARR